MRNIAIALLAVLLVACGSAAPATNDATGASAPAASAPAASAPEASAPEASTPAASEPAASVPAVSTPPEASTEASTEPDITLPDTSAAAGGDVPEAVLSQIRQTMEQEFNVPTDAFTVQSAEVMEWSDGSLGCPDPNMSYTQAIVPGYLLTVTDGTQTYELHTNQDGSNVVVCQNGAPLQP